jgi:hypothetical protein
MPQFDAAPAVTSNPFSVNGKQFPSRNREMRRRPRNTFCSRSLRRAGGASRHRSCGHRQALHACGMIRAGPPRHATFCNRCMIASARASKLPT